MLALITAYLMFFGAVITELTALLAIALPVIFVIFFLRSPFLAAIIVIPAGLTFLTAETFIPVATLLAPLFIMGAGASVMLHTKPWVGVLMAAVPLGAAVAYTGQWLPSAQMLVYFLCGALLALLLARGASRATILWAPSALFLATDLLSVLPPLINGGKDALSRILTEQLEALRTEGLAVYLEYAAAQSAERRALLTEEMYHAMFDLSLMLSPAILIIGALFAVFAAHLLTLSLCRKSGRALRFSRSTMVFQMSRVSAVIFSLSLLLSLFSFGTSDAARTVSATAMNLFLILLLPFALTGILGVFSVLRRQQGCLSIWMIVLLVFFMPTLLIAALALATVPLALFGVFITFKTPSTPVDGH